MARAGDAQDGYSDFGGGPNKSWLRVKAPNDPSSRTGAGLADKPGGLVLEAVTDAGVVTTYWLWVDSAGLLHSSTTEPTDQNLSTTIMAPKNIQISTIGLDPGILTAGSTIEITTTITGVAAGDLVLLELPAFTGGDVTGFRVDQVARISAANTVRVRFTNMLTGTNNINPHNGGATYRYFWIDLT